MKNREKPFYTNLDVTDITKEITETYKKVSKKDEIHPAQYERLIIDLLAYKETLLRAKIQSH